jgi:hypothetical protein
MSDSLPRTTGSESPALSHTLTDRVLARVRIAELAVDQRTKAIRPRLARHRSDPDPLSASVTRTPEQVREARSLRRVFLELGQSYRDYRRRTGAPVSQDVRDAACRFRREVTVASLVSVAASLDQLEVLAW